MSKGTLDVDDLRSSAERAQLDGDVSRLSAAAQAVAMRPVPDEAIRAIGSAAASLAMKIDTERYGTRGSSASVSAHGAA